MKRLAIVLAVVFSTGAAGPAWGKATFNSSSLGKGLSVGYGTVGDNDAIGLGVTGMYIGTYGVETRKRGIAAGNIFLQGSIEVWGLQPDDIYSLDVSLLWLPKLLPSKLRPYVGMGGGGGNLYQRLPEGTYNTGIQPKASAIVGIAYRAGWGDSIEDETMQSTWFIELRVGQYFGDIGMNEIVLRQGLVWLRF